MVDGFVFGCLGLANLLEVHSRGCISRYIQDSQNPFLIELPARGRKSRPISIVFRGCFRGRSRVLHHILYFIHSVYNTMHF